MSESQPTEAQIIAVLKQVEAGHDGARLSISLVCDHIWVELLALRCRSQG
jgi:hypothetical protein